MRLHPMAELDREASRFYQTALHRLIEAEIDFLVGGAYALERHTGIVRHTKDFDIFVLPSDARRTLKTLERAGYQTDLMFPHWLGKAFYGEYFIDVIFNSGNGLCHVDEDWFEHALDEVVLDIPVRVCPVEETIWQKSFILERDRCDSADVAHLLRFCAHTLDWSRLLRRFGRLWRVLLAHLILFGFVYPSERGMIPKWVMDELALRLKSDTSSAKKPTAQENGPGPRVCQGTLLSATQYVRDIDLEGFKDARLAPLGTMSPEDLAKWTANFVKP